MKGELISDMTVIVLIQWLALKGMKILVRKGDNELNKRVSSSEKSQFRENWQKPENPLVQDHLKQLD